MTLAESRPGSETIHPQYRDQAGQRAGVRGCVFTCDVGTPTVWAARYLEMNGRRRLVGSFNHGSMANALLQAIGAQAAYPGARWCRCRGDGGFTMMMGDFLTLAQLGLPVKVIVLNNGTLGFVELEMKAGGFLDYGCELKNPDFAAMAEPSASRVFGSNGRRNCGRPCGGLRPRRAGPGGRGQRTPGARAAAQDECGRGQQVRSVHAKGRAGRAHERVDRPRQGQPSSLTSRRRGRGLRKRLRFTNSWICSVLAVVLK